MVSVRVSSLLVRYIVKCDPVYVESGDYKKLSYCRETARQLRMST